MAESVLIANRIKNAVQEICSKKQIYVSNFLNPLEQHLWSQEYKRVKLAFFGGFPQAERKVVVAMALSDKTPIANASYQIVPLAATISSFSPITHRQLLGYLMHQGLNRQFIGDILLTEGQVQIIVKGSIVKFFLDQTFKINQHNLAFKVIDFDQIAVPQVDVQLKKATVASLRVDAVLAKILNLSRNKVQDLISQGQVFVNFRQVIKSTYLLTENDLVTVRRFARIKMKNVVGRSKKDKIMIVYQKI